ncbi:hypothetical protein [Epilithonimonas mollis]|uniref:DUF3945 domain-containing protein n=1 Tax=Epilithonimonas mollis TaxID=216903 RepID=A0A1M6UBR5_9FLAO|nr:hypothetical protein [Epilithonimonas mollis]SHK66601.1 hypothetical protein SAMN05444371_3266 [Epilithonimonas mollis]
MENHNLPTEDLKTYGIINEDLTFSQKLSPDDVQKFLRGYTIVADNDRNRATFQLTDNNTQLKVIFLERDKSLSEILKKSKDQIQYSETRAQYNDNGNSTRLSFSKQAFVFDEETNTVKELDLIKNAPDLTAIIADKKDIQELNRYKNELQNLKNFLYDKIDLYPEIAKEIRNDINIISGEIDTVDGISQDMGQMKKRAKSNIRLNVDDPDLYDKANRMVEESGEQEEDLQKSKRRGR